MIMDQLDHDAIEQLELEHLLQLDQVAEAIRWPVRRWKGNCYAVACKMLEAGLLVGEAQYGKWWGPVAPSSMFFGKPYPNHGWIAIGEGWVCDPTRWAFTQPDNPEMFIGPADFYDLGANEFNKAFRRAAPDATLMERTLRLPSEALSRLACQHLPMRANLFTISHQQAGWLANLALDELGELAEPLYTWLQANQCKAYVPIDNWQEVME